jgi:uncharacterized protein DUF5666
MRKGSFVLMTVLLLTALVHAHGNAVHVLGTVTAVSEVSISVKTTTGETKVVTIDAETKFLKGDSAAALGDIHVGDRVVIHAHSHEGKLHAAEVKLGATHAVHE